MFITAWQRLRIVLLLFYIFSYHTFDFSAKKNLALWNPPTKIFCVRHCQWDTLTNLNLEKQHLPVNLNGVRAQFFDQVKYLGVWINSSLKDDDDIQKQVKSLYCAANKLRGTFDQCSPAVKNTQFHAYCMPMYACQLWSKYTQTSMKRLRAAYNNAYRIMHYIPRNVSVRPHQVSHSVRTFDAVLRTNLYRFFLCDAHLHPTFLFDRFKCLMLFANLHFSSIIQRSCMVETKRSSWPWIVSVFASHQYCFCHFRVVKICGHTKHKKVRSGGKVFCASQGWTRTNNGCVMPYSMVIHFLCSCEWRYSCGEDKALCSSRCWSCANTVSVMCADV